MIIQPADLNQSGRVNLLLLLAIFFGIGTVVFGSISIVSYDAKVKAESNRDAQVNAAVSKAVEKAIKEDEAADIKAAESPYRTYTADGVFGGFSLDIPKSWNIYAEKSVSAQTQLTLIASPDSVSVDRALGRQLQPFKATLVQKSAQSIASSYQERIKRKKLTSSTVTVSGIQSTQLVGTFSEEQTQPTTLVLVPVRDKTLQFANDDRNYTEQFGKILASAKITP